MRDQVVAGSARRGDSPARRRYSRRLFLGGMGVAALGAGAVALRFMWPDSDPVAATQRIAADDLPAAGGDPLAMSLDGYGAYLVRLEGADGAGETIALSRECPHEGCSVPWEQRVSGPDGNFERVFRCPCCGSTFTREARVLVGPARHDLARLELAVQRNGDIVVTIPVPQVGPIPPGLPR